MNTIAIHEECGRSIAEHCAFCDTCDCGCSVEDTIGATAERNATAAGPEIHEECDKPRCAACGESILMTLGGTWLDADNRSACRKLRFESHYPR